MLSYTATSDAPPEEAWALLARPARWHEWAPHIRGARALGEPEVEAGRSGSIRLFGTVAVPARIVAKDPGRSWTWQVGPVRSHHRVAPREGSSAGSLVTVDLVAPRALEALLSVTYGPLTHVLVRNLARVADSGS